MSIKTFQNKNTKGLFRLIHHEKLVTNDYIDQGHGLLTIAWNKGLHQQVTIDEVTYDLPASSIIALLANQTFSFTDPMSIIAWQFNRDFYCIVDHDHEVSCSGLLFYGMGHPPIISLDAEEHERINLLYKVFLDEFADNDSLQEDMMRVLLKRLIIKSTRLLKRQHRLDDIEVSEIDLIRQFNLLVEQKYKEWHQVQDYAAHLYKSPKTISNVFSKYAESSPLKVIHQRIALEAKRQLLYTEASVKEIAFDLGFEEVSPFNRMFKKVVGLSPSAFKKGGD